MFNDTIDTQRANRRLIRKSMNAPLLTRDHELELARRWRTFGDERALHELIKSYMRLVISRLGASTITACPSAIWCRKGWWA